MFKRACISIVKGFLSDPFLGIGSLVSVITFIMISLHHMNVIQCKNILLLHYLKSIEVSLLIIYLYNLGNRIRFKK